MIYELKKEYKKNLLLSRFSLENNYFDDNWINGLLENPIVENIYLLDDSNNLTKTNFWISFKIFQYPEKSKGFYKKMHNDMKIFVKKEWSIFKNPCALYSTHKINSKTKNNIEYLCLYISPNKNINKFDFSLIKNQDYLLQNCFDLLFKSRYIDDLKEHTAFADIHSGTILFNPVVLKNFVSAYKVNMNYKSHILDFELELKRYHLEDNNNITLSDDLCFNNKKYTKKADARKVQSGGRKFLNFESYDLLDKTKFINQLKVYQKFEEMLKKFNINYEQCNFKPEYLINDFNSYENLKDLNVWVSNEDIKDFKKMFPQEQDLIDYLNSKYHDKKGKLKQNDLNIKKAHIKVANNLDDLIKYKAEANLYIMREKLKETKDLDKDMDELLVIEICNGVEKSYDNVIEIFLERNLSILSEIEFKKSINNFDLYSQIKLYNLYCNKNKLDAIVSQGLIINFNNAVGEKNNESLRQEKFKSINELTLKYQLFVKKIFNLPFSAKNIKILEKYSKNQKTMYSYIVLIKEDGLFKIIEKTIFIDNEINNINCDIDINASFENNNLCILLDDKYLITYKNTIFPSIILNENTYNSQQNPLCEINYHQQNGSTKSSISRNVNDLTYFPYIAKAATQLIDGKANHSKSLSAFCIFDYQKNELYSFVKASLSSVDSSILKQTRVETMLLNKKNGLFYEEEQWENNKNIAFEILSTKTINQLVNNSVSKKSILHKLSNILIEN